MSWIRVINELLAPRMASILKWIASLAGASPVPVIRVGGALASALICAHSFSFLSAGQSERHAWLRFIHNVADIVLFMGFGVSGIVAELFPRDSPTYRILKSNFPFLMTLVGRGIFYVILGCLVMGDLTSGSLTARKNDLTVNEDQDSDDSLGFWGYFTVLSGLYIVVTGIAQLYMSVKSRSFRSLHTAELSQPIVAFVPSPGLVARAPQQVEVTEPVLPTPV
jgi:hypothetical protein